MWKQLNPPTVPSLEKYPPDQAKRFTDICITHLIIHRQSWIKDKMNELNIDNQQKAIEFVISDFDYPLVMGQDCDKTNLNKYCGKACYEIDLDYWNTGNETLMTYILNKKLKNGVGWGDCEDVSILVTSLLRILGADSWEMLGAVYRGSTLLGGHGYNISKLNDGKYHLVEATLSKPPKYPDGYPIVDISKNSWTIGNITYKADIRFNDLEYYEWSGGNMKFDNYIRLRRRDKETYRKYKAISEAHGILAKPLKKRGLLARLRWK